MLNWLITFTYANPYFGQFWDYNFQHLIDSHLIESFLLKIFIWAQFHQRSTYSFYARGAQKCKKDSQVISLFMLLGSTRVKAERKCVGEIEP